MSIGQLTECTGNEGLHVGPSLQLMVVIGSDIAHTLTLPLVWYIVSTRDSDKKAKGNKDCCKRSQGKEKALVMDIRKWHFLADIVRCVGLLALCGLG